MSSQERDALRERARALRARRMPLIKIAAELGVSKGFVDRALQLDLYRARDRAYREGGRQNSTVGFADTHRAYKAPYDPAARWRA